MRQKKTSPSRCSGLIFDGMHTTQSALRLSSRVLGLLFLQWTVASLYKKLLRHSPVRLYGIEGSVLPSCLPLLAHYCCWICIMVWLARTPHPHIHMQRRNARSLRSRLVVCILVLQKSLAHSLILQSACSSPLSAAKSYGVCNVLAFTTGLLIHSTKLRILDG